VHPLSQEGRIFTMCLIVMGVGTAAWALGTGIEVVLGENLWQSVQRRRLMKDIMNLSNHYIVCGYGRMGRQIVNDLKNRGEDFVVIELSGQTEERLLEKGYPHVIGDAEDNSVLIRAGIERARGLVAALDTDAANVLTVLSARELRADLLIVARATNENTEGKLRRAGADRVVSPDAIGGHRLALALLQPKVHDFLGKIFNIEELEVDIGEIVIDEGSRLAGITVAGTNFKERWNVTILAIQTTGEEFIISPDAQRVIVPGETLIVIGPLQAISRIGAEFSA
jgi:voltage-gated potassium channel